jgi:hypothetical protein
VLTRNGRDELERPQLVRRLRKSSLPAAVDHRQ